MRAESSGALIIGFNVKTPANIENLMREKNIKVNSFNIIYNLIKFVRDEMEKLIEVEIKRNDLGRLKVLAIFRTEKTCQIIGGKVLDGRIEKDSLIEVEREKNIITHGKLIALQSGKTDVATVEKDQECGLKFEGKPVIQIGDVMNFYKEERIVKRL
jgi:translation initiation factor IF-2